MTTQSEQERIPPAAKPARLTLDIDPELHLRIKIAATQAHLSMREYIERILRAAVPQQPQQATPLPQHWRPISRETVERLRQTLDSITDGRVISDSTPIIRYWREEHK